MQTPILKKKNFSGHRPFVQQIKSKVTVKNQYTQQLFLPFKDPWLSSANPHRGALKPRSRPLGIRHPASLFTQMGLRALCRPSCAYCSAAGGRIRCSVGSPSPANARTSCGSSKSSAVGWRPPPSRCPAVLSLSLRSQLSRSIKGCCPPIYV